jgi:hypothetical protein
MKGDRITISQETKNGLAKFAKPFESEDDCLKRILSCSCVQDEMKKSKDMQESEGKDLKKDELS